ncbi:transcription initiation factor IID, 31kD subunit-domain-containing protein [Podospora appendiculata]|uniref:Transcription initiation factor IID, 31kD subunit-domain-containing protein n=1 Tax=Podospora appendiculata TaxID=314037 RepID=A0AAE0XI80_9PEZI|nr:transcription initiation factor IID, 31kD subunit-domain-containing protein [Podospora appendiculata]
MSSAATQPAPQVNGVASTAATTTSQPATTTTTTSAQPSQPSQPPSQQTTLVAQSQSQPQSQQQQPPQPHHPQPPTSPSAAAPRPRDARTIELLLTAQGVTAFEQRVPLLLLDFAYRHTSAVLSDALHLSADPYTSHAGARPSAASGAAPVNVGDATVSANAVQLAISSRLGFQFRGGSGGGGPSKEWLMDLARQTNRTMLPRIMTNEWGVRLPAERFVLNGLSWGLRDAWAGQDGADDDSSDEDEDMDDGDAAAADAMQGVEIEDIGGDGVEGGTMDDVFGDEQLDEDEDQEMVEV